MSLYALINYVKNLSHILVSFPDDSVWFSRIEAGHLRLYISGIGRAEGNLCKQEFVFKSSNQGQASKQREMEANEL